MQTAFASQLLAVQEFADELALGFKPVAHIMTMITNTSDIDLKSTVGDLRMGEFSFRQSNFRHYHWRSPVSSRSTSKWRTSLAGRVGV